jgi:hypothetical protein
MAITAHFKGFSILFWVNFGQKNKKAPLPDHRQEGTKKDKKGMKLRPF